MRTQRRMTQDCLRTPAHSRKNTQGSARTAPNPRNASRAETWPQVRGVWPRTLPAELGLVQAVDASSCHHPPPDRSGLRYLPIPHAHPQGARNGRHARRAPQSMAKQAVQTPQDIHRFRLCIQAKFAKWLTSGRKSVSIAPELQRSRTGRNQSIGEQQGLGQVEWRCRARRDGR